VSGYSHAENMAILYAEMQRWEDRAEQDYNNGKRTLDIPEDIRGQVIPGSYRKRMNELLCAEVHDQDLCCIEHKRHLGTLRTIHDTACTVCGDPQSAQRR
jgi:hypothetical protein